MGETVESIPTMKCINALVLLWATMVEYHDHLSYTVQSIHSIVNVEKWSM